MVEAVLRESVACRGRAMLRCGVVLAAVWLSSCAVADQFAPRAVAYNIEAENARDQTLLLNIIRAAYRKPMQFSDLVSVTGTATATGTVGSSLLVGPHQAASASNLSPGVTFAGGPTFTVNTLDTKEFYSGILAPIDKSLVDYYTSIRIPRQVLYTLLFAEIDIDTGTKHIIIPNNPDCQAKWDAFQNVLSSLLDAGLTIRLKRPTNSNFGPILSAHSLSDPEKLADLAKEKIDLVPVKRKSGGPTLYWHAVKDKPQVTFSVDHPQRVLAALATISEKSDNARCAGRRSNRQARLHPWVATAATRTLLPGVTVRIRSIEGVIYFLGEITRFELGLDGENAKPIRPWLCFKKHGDLCDTGKDVLFSLRPPYSGTSISTTYQGQAYSMDVDPSGLNHSAQVLEFVTQLLALSSSSKDLPAPSVVTLIGH